MGPAVVGPRPVVGPWWARGGLARGSWWARGGRWARGSWWARGGPMMYVPTCRGYLFHLHLYASVWMHLKESHIRGGSVVVGPCWWARGGGPEVGPWLAHSGGPVVVGRWLPQGSFYFCHCHQIYPISSKMCRFIKRIKGFSSKPISFPSQNKYFFHRRR
jgi:hypothetical protein